jgi:hypothetical protein
MSYIVQPICLSVPGMQLFNISMREQCFTPLTELPNEVCDLDSYIPEFAHPQQIGIDMARVQRLALLGGFRPAVRILGISDEQHNEAPMLVGYTADGTGYAAASRVARAQEDLLAKGTWQADKSEDVYRARQDLTLGVRMSDLADVVQRTGAARNTAVWSEKLHIALSNGIRDAAWRHLVGDRPPLHESLITTGVGMTSAIVYTVMTLPPTAHPEIGTSIKISLATEGVVLTVGFTALFRKMLSRSEEFGKGEYFGSLIPIWHIDRALAVSALSRVGKLVASLQD